MNYDKELAFAKALALEAGAIARQYFVNDIVHQEKPDNTPLTIADSTINRLVIERVKQQYPGVGVLGEEASEVGTDKDQVWVCDPIDGTIPYVLDMPIGTFCLAFVVDGVPEIGVVYDFNANQLFSAVRGDRAFLNDQPLTMSAQAPMKIVELAWFRNASYNLSGLREKFFADNYQVLNYASLNYLATKIATGKLPAAIYAGDKAWDVAAAKVIVEAAGGVVSDLSGNEQRYDGPIKGAIVAHRDYHAYMVRTVGL